MCAVVERQLIVLQRKGCFQKLRSDISTLSSRALPDIPCEEGVSLQRPGRLQLKCDVTR